MLDRNIHLTPIELMLSVVIAKFLTDASWYLLAKLIRRLRRG